MNEYRSKNEPPVVPLLNLFIRYRGAQNNSLVTLSNGYNGCLSGEEKRKKKKKKKKQQSRDKQETQHKLSVIRNVLKLISNSRKDGEQIKNMPAEETDAHLILPF